MIGESLTDTQKHDPTSEYKVYSHSDFLRGEPLFTIDAHIVDALDEDHEDDDMDLFYRLKLPESVLVMKIRQSL